MHQKASKRTSERKRGKDEPRPHSREQRAGQTIWSGTISFSLVAIPVQLVKAVDPGRVSFRMLHSKDNSPLSRRMLCPKEDKIVPPDEIVRGYDLGQENYVVVTDRELESVSPERSRTIEITEFTELDHIDLIYYDYPYYLVPSKGGEKAYTLLAQVMEQTKKAGLARFVLREREYLVAIKSTGGALSLMTLHYKNEVLSDEEIAPAGAKTASPEKERIKKAIRTMIVEFSPDKYANERRHRITTFLEKKAKVKGTVEAPETEEQEGESPADLVAVLQESMRKVKKAS